MAKISIIGAGSWGTALGLLLCNNGHDVTICSENEKEIEELKGTQRASDEASGVKLPDEMKFTCDVRGSLSGQDILVMAKASPYVRTTCKKYAADIPDGQLIVNVAKGVEADTLMTVSQIIEEKCRERMSLFSPDRATQRKSAAACRPRSLSARMTARVHCMCRMCS